MSDVFDFNTGLKTESTSMKNTPTDECLAQRILSELYKDRDKVKEIITIVKFNSDEVVVMHSGPLLSDKCLALQLLQHDINLDIGDMNENA